MGSELGFTIAGEEALLVALDAQQALAGREVGEVPHLFAHHAGELVKCLEVLLVVIDLVLLRVHYGRGVVHAGDRVGSKFGKHNRLAHARPKLKLAAKQLAGVLDIRSAKIPTVITVEADDVGELGGYIVFGAHRLNADQRAGAVLRVKFMRQVKERLEVVVRAVVAVGVGFVGDAPHDNAGVVLVACDKVADNVLVMLLRLHAVLGVKRLDVLAAKVRAAAKAKVDAHRRGLVHHNNALGIAKTHHFLAVGIVACAEAVCPLPLHERDVLHVHGQVLAAACREGVLMLAVTLEVEGLLVNKELCALDADRADAVGQLVDVFAIGCLDGVEVGCAGVP